MSLKISLLRYLPRPRHLVQGAVLLPLIVLPLVLILGPSQSIALGAPEYQKRGTRCVLAVPLENRTEGELTGLSLTLVWQNVAQDYQGLPLDRSLKITVPTIGAGDRTTLVAAPPLPERCDVYQRAPRAEVQVTGCAHSGMATTACRHAIRRGSDGEMWKFD
ncbi:MAG: hypothetical protein Alpg2KO_23250 [Alphaproteobacteria bacterium]